MIFSYRKQLFTLFCALWIVLEGSNSVFFLPIVNAQSRISREARPASQFDSAQIMVQEMQSALKSIPWKDLSPAAQSKIRNVVSGAPLFRRLPQQTIYADPEIYSFLLQHPDVVIGFWEALGATQLSLREIKENQFLLKETAGTAAVVDVLYRTDNLCIVFARGEYRGPLISKQYSGNVVLILRSRFIRDEQNEPMTVCDLDAFVQIDSLGVDMLAKLFFSTLTKTADSNFEVTVSFVSQVSNAAGRNTDGLKGTAQEISTIRQDVFAEFCGVIDRAANRYARRNQPIPFASSTLPERTLPQNAHPLPPEPANEKPAESQDTLSRDTLLTFSKPPADWEMDHLHFGSPFFKEPLSTPKPIEPNSSDNEVPKLPTPGG